MKGEFTRRSFLGLAGLGILSGSSSSHAEPAIPENTSLTVLFQGDSITDGNRGRSDDPNHILGHGYAFAIASRLGSEYPERRLSFINKGISGDTVGALHKRWKADALDLKPDVVSILVGVNDVLFRLRSGNFSTPPTYEQELRKLLEETRQSLPQAKLVLCEPFILLVGMVKENPERWSAEIKAAQEASLKLAAEFDCIHIRFQHAFTKALKRAPAEYWIWDGIHPTTSGHGLMATEWMNEVGKVIPALRLNK